MSKLSPHQLQVCPMTVSIEAHSFITIPLKTFHEPQASFIQCLKEPSYAKTLKDLCKQASKSENLCPKKNPLSNKVGYLRWQNIFPRDIKFARKGGRGWLDNQMIEESTVKFLPHFNFCTSSSFLFLSIYFLFVTIIYLLMFDPVRELQLVFYKCFGVQVWGMSWSLHTSVFLSHGIVSLNTLGQCII
jgi:hypothetical protein